MTRLADGHCRVPANDNPVWHWRGICKACRADMGPVRDSSRCLDCLAGERAASTPAEDALWAGLLRGRPALPAGRSDDADMPRRW